MREEIMISGVIFSYDPATSTYTKLVYLDGIKGDDPYGALCRLPMENYTE
jgi:hypothetical protein